MPPLLPLPSSSTLLLASRVVGCGGQRLLLVGNEHRSPSLVRAGHAARTHQQQQHQRQLSSSSLRRQQQQGIAQQAGPPLVANGLEMTSLFVPSLDGKHRLHVKRVRARSYIDRQTDTQRAHGPPFNQISTKADTSADCISLPPTHLIRSVATQQRRVPAPPPPMGAPCACSSTAPCRTAASSTPRNPSGTYCIH